LIFEILYTNLPVINPTFGNRLAFITNLLVPFIMLPLALILDTMILKRPSRVFWILLAGALFTSILFLTPLVSSVTTIFVIYLVIVFLEIIRKIIIAIRKRIDGSRVMGAGIMIFVLFFLSIILVVVVTGGFSLGEEDQGVLVVVILLLISILSIPISMSIYLARDFAVTNRNLARQLEEVQRLSALTLEQEREKKRILEGQKEKLEVLVKERTAELEAEKDKTEDLLHNILPDKVVKELKEKGTTEPEHFRNVTVYFSDIVGFTSQSGQLEPELLISELNEIFTAFDDIMVGNGCERIKTIGDAYLAVCGMPEEDPEHAEKMARSAIKILEYLRERNKISEVKWQIRVGIHSGDVVGSVVGVRKYIYDVFGDTINTAARMEQHSEPMKINVSPATKQLLEKSFQFTERPVLEIKGKGRMEMFFLDFKR
jgi:class 3 adenylate cyclase